MKYKPELQWYRDPVQDSFVWELRAPTFYIVTTRFWRVRVAWWLLAFIWEVLFGKLLSRKRR